MVLLSFVPFLKVCKPKKDLPRPPGLPMAEQAETPEEWRLRMNQMLDRNAHQAEAAQASEEFPDNQDRISGNDMSEEDIEWSDYLLSDDSEADHKENSTDLIDRADLLPNCLPDLREPFRDCVVELMYRYDVCKMVPETNDTKPAPGKDRMFVIANKTPKRRKPNTEVRQCLKKIKVAFDPEEFLKRMETTFECCLQPCTSYFFVYLV
jgi:hypothetical protein